MRRNYVFRVQPLGAGPGRRFQLRIGMEGEQKIDHIPAHRTALAQRFPIGIAHASEVDVHLELSGLLEWMANGET